MKPALCVLVLATAATAEEPGSQPPLSPPPLVQGVPAPGAPLIEPEPPTRVPLDAPVAQPSAANALELQGRLLDWRGRLLDEQRPSLGAPITFATISVVTLVASGVLLGVLRPWSTGVLGYWVPPLAVLAVHLAFATPAAVMFPERIRERQEFDAHPARTLVDAALEEVTASLEHRPQTAPLPLVPLDDDALGSDGRETTRELRREAPRWSPTVRAAQKQLEREKLLEQRAQLLSDMPSRAGGVHRLVAGTVLAALSLVDWVLFAGGGHHMFDNPRNAGANTLGALVIVVGIVLAAGSVGLLLTGRSELMAIDLEREKVEREVREVEHRLEALDRVKAFQ